MGAIYVTKVAATIWLYLYPFVSTYRFDSVGAGPGLIWVKLKSEFTNKKSALKITPNTIDQAQHLQNSSEFISKVI